MKARIGNQWREPLVGKCFVNGSWRPLNVVKAYVDGAWRTVGNFVQTLTASVFPTAANGTGTSGTTSSWNVTVTPSGGLAPFTYAWSFKSGADTFTAGNPTSATTYFYGSTPTVRFYTGTMTCLVTDSLGTTVNVDVPVELERQEPGGPAS